MKLNHGVVQGRHFLLFEIDESDSLLNALIDLYNRKELKETLAANAYNYAKEFSWKNISSMHLELYRKIVG